MVILRFVIYGTGILGQASEKLDLVVISQFFQNMFPPTPWGAELTNFTPPTLS